MITLAITDIAFGGKGVGRINGKAAFVPYVIDGETVSARPVRERKKFIEAELETVHEPSPHRVQPRCPYFGRCGGCVYQHIHYSHQLTIKARQVQQALARIGGIANAPVRPMIASPLQYEYRNRITVHVRDGIIGFFGRESNRLLDIERCPISSAEVNARLAAFRAQQPADGNYTLREQNGPRVFTQANDAAAGLLLELVSRSLESSAGLLVDAYCGAGFFAKRLSARFDQVIGIDWDRHAIALARTGAAANESYIAGDVAEELARYVEKANALIVDPPAAGLSNSVRKAITERRPERLIYISCDPATLARDLSELQTAFSIDSVTPLDMFAQTAEIETVVSLRARA